MGAARVHAKACLALFLSAGLAQAAMPPNTSIVNTATASFTVSGVPIAVGGAATVVTSAGTPASVLLLGYAANATGLPAGYATRQPVAATQCEKAGTGLALLPAPVTPGNGTLAVPGNYLLAPTTVYATGDAVFVQVTDLDQNLNAAVADTITVTVQAANGDSETLRLAETGPSTGVFTGYIQITAGAVQGGNCVLTASGNQRITVSYVDDSEGHVSVTAAALIDPLGVVFDAASGQAVDGARVTVINIATGQPAVVLGNDGVSAYPSSVLTGETVTDAGGASYPMGPGRYQFPRLHPGSYSFRVEPPAGFRFPSKAPDQALSVLPGAPYHLSAASRGEVFTLIPGPAIEIDIPVDPGPIGEVAIVKTAGKSVAAIGDFVPYTLGISNRGTWQLPGVVIADRLPPGFRYQKGSARLNDAVLADPQVSADGRGLQFSLGNLAANASVSVRYVAAVTPSAQPGQAENTAQSVGRVTSNVAKAFIQVREDLNRSRAILAGRVTLAQSCDADAKVAGAVQGLAGVRVLLEDGTFIATDADGNWHADNIRAGTHVVQLDTTTLPQGFEFKSCVSNSRTGGRDFSQFVNVRGGSLWRADFQLVRAASCLRQQFQRNAGRTELRLSAPVANQSVSATVMLPAGARVVADSLTLDGKALSGVKQEDSFLVLRLPAQRGRWNHVFSFATEAPLAGEVKASVRVQPLGQAATNLPPLVLPAGNAEADQCSPLPLGAPGATPAVGAATAATVAAEARGETATPSLIEQLPYDDKWLAAAPAGNEWLHPRTDFTPALPVIKVAVKHAKGSRIDLKVNGAAVDPLRYEGSVLSPTGEWALSNWRAVDLRDGANTLDVVIRDATGAVLLQESRVIHFSSAPARVELDAQRSRLVADGRSSPVIAVRMLDAEGHPARRGLTGEFQLNSPYLSQQQADALQRDPLAGNLGGVPKFQIGEDGVALIPLQPTTQSGEVVLRFAFGQRMQEVRTWLSADLREWVLVGFAEGTLAHKRLSGNLEALDASGDQLTDGNRIAFYAKGQVRGEFLVTAAYDSAKQRGTPAGQALKQAVDPNQYYTLYADAAQAQFDAASTKKLYLKIEKKQFYALFGDIETGLTVTELGRYSRTLTGLKSEYQGERFSYNAFAAKTSQNFVKDELQGDGTSGLYRLRGRNLLLNSEKIRIEVRDRFHPDQVLSTRALTPYLDYQLDPAQGTLFFREPIPSRDEALNPILIVAEYETDDQATANWTYGGRAAVKVGKQSEVGVTRIHEGTGGREANLTAVDATVRIGDNTRIRAEAATSERNSPVGPQSGNAWLAEVTHDDGKTAVRAYAAQQQPGFGLGQQAAAAAGQRSVGADARVKISDQVQVAGTTYRQQDLVNGGRRDVVEGQAEWTDKEGLTVRAGARAANERDGAGNESEARQLTAGVAYEMMDRRLVLRASTDLDVGSRGTVNFPNRLVLGADYRLTPETTLSATHEIARGDLLKADTTRIGLRTNLWAGAELQVGGGSQGALDANRLYGSMGLVQKLKISEHWQADVGVDRVQTFKTTLNPLGPAQPPASGTAAAAGAAYGLVTGDYTAVTGGLNYQDGVWSGNARAEWRDSDTDTKVNLLLGAQRKLSQGRVVAAGLSVLSQRGLTDSRNVAARLSYAARPEGSDWMWLSKLEYVEDSSAGTSLASQLFTRKLIANFNGNWKATRDTQVAVQYGAKYVREMIGDTSYSGYTDLFSVEARHDITDRWDVGLHAGLLHSWRTGTRSAQLGVSVGYRLADNTWVAVGYNQYGFTDPDFSGAEYRGKGLYVSLRVKVDQDTFDLNDRAKSQLPLKP